jgi:hypothetical protein
MDGGGRVKNVRYLCLIYYPWYGLYISRCLVGSINGGNETKLTVLRVSKGYVIFTISS